MRTRQSLIVLLLLLLFGGAAFTFWQQEMRYLQPTPVPTEYQAVLPHQKIDLSDYLGEPLTKPLLLHFFSADCPCSRFNIDHFRYLSRNYRDSIDFYVVLPSPEVSEAARQFRQRYDMDIPVLIDQQERLAQSCGVYSTPQVAIITQEGRLYFRGNYNRARYCTTKSTSFAELTIKSLLQGAPPPVFVEAATQSYGCQLPSQREDAPFILNF